MMDVLHGGAYASDLKRMFHGQWGVEERKKGRFGYHMVFEED